ncbi:bifunctional enoyl-CoA hydratase/phosphate acetyltransferase [Virgibacillus soli]|uniref:Bifunctional enoyl-CoA hydratase/phosphate acetyltransferase n=1 Tax=Paracerasibacillus soli TaxID=480284 RepID=A0ABU5CPV2_9BACI|nr:bifunctional enoyl-CoA hydratase/phosphate acetyltransferase [Virgibacillus soli]MDY0408390.1 bifunctional enoyl-CoA hydratase/phosphate acetyltransferase [Virgibacillus soli]
MNTLASLRNLLFAQTEKKIISVANAGDEQVLLAVKQAVEMKICRFLLLGDEIEINKLAKKVGLDLSSTDIQTEHVTEEVGKAAVLAIRQKRAHVLMKGLLPTKEILQAVLDKENGLRTKSVLSHVALFEIPDQNRLIFLTDAAMNIAPNVQLKKNIIENAVEVARNLGNTCPNVALLAPVEVVNEAMPSTVDAAILTTMQNRGQIKYCNIDGPLAFDLAISPEAVQHKHLESPVAGNADILVVPSIEVGNALYKSFVYFAKAKVASVVWGAKVPIILTSRSDSAESKWYSMLLSLCSQKDY